MIRRIVCAVVLFFLSPFYTNTFVNAEVVINELLPKTDPPTYEWVELYNTESVRVSLDRWHIDHTATDGKSYILNASAVIEPHGFLTLSGTQTAINFSIEGDTVRLFNADGTLVDSQKYPGTLGYNTTVGRSSDGGDGWVVCAPDPYNATPGKPNNCPPSPSPTLTSTPTPTVIPTLEPLPTHAVTPRPTPASTRQTFASFLPSPTEYQVLGLTKEVSPTPTPDPTTLTVKMDKILAYQILSVVIAWSVIALVANIQRKKRV